MSDRRRWVERPYRAMHALFTSKERGFSEARIEAAAVIVRNAGEQ